MFVASSKIQNQQTENRCFYGKNFNLFLWYFLWEMLEMRTIYRKYSLCTMCCIRVFMNVYHTIFYKYVLYFYTSKSASRRRLETDYYNTCDAALTITTTRRSSLIFLTHARHRNPFRCNKYFFFFFKKKSKHHQKINK